MLKSITYSAALFSMLSLAVQGAENIYGMKPGKLELQSISVLAFGPDGILFIGDPQAATISALETGDKKDDAAVSYDIPAISQKIAEQLKVQPASVRITDLAVNPETQHVFLAVAVDKQSPQILKLDGTGKLTPLNLEKATFSKADLPNAAEDKEVGEGRRRRNNRLNSITDLAFVDGQLVVSGLSKDEAAANVWSLMFPFQKVDHGTTIEIYHGAHGRSEDYAPIKTFVPVIVDGEPNLLAGYVCTPLVKFPLSQLSSASANHGRVQGTTMAELGNHNQPLDMIAYEKDGKNWLLLSNSARGVMKISTEGIARDEGITSPISGGGTAGQTYDTIENLKGTVQLDKLGDRRAVVLIQHDNGQLNLKTISLP